MEKGRSFSFIRRQPGYNILMLFQERIIAGHNRLSNAIGYFDQVQGSIRPGFVFLARYRPEVRKSGEEWQNFSTRELWKWEPGGQ